MIIDYADNAEVHPPRRSTRQPSHSRAVSPRLSGNRPEQALPLIQRIVVGALRSTNG